MKIIAKRWICCALLLFATAAWGGEMAMPGEPGVAEGTGITFQLDGFVASPVTLDTSDVVRIFATSDPGNISIYMEAAAGQTLTAVTLSGLQPMTTYYTYVDHLYLQVPVLTDEAGSFSVNLDLTNPITFIVKVKPSTIFLSADPWVDGNGISHSVGWSHSDGTDLNGIQGTWDAVTRTATLLADATELIEIRGNSITLEGNGFSCRYESGGPSAGIYANHIMYLTIRNLSFSSAPLSLGRSYFGVFEGLSFTNGGIWLDGQRNVIDNSNFTNASIAYFPFSYYNTIKNSVFSSGGFWCYGLTSSNEFLDNQFLGGITAISTYNSDYNTFSGNHIENYVNGVVLGGSSTNALSEFNQVYNNNFVNIGTPVSITTLSKGNLFNLPAPDGGNYFSNWTGPDDNFDGLVDLPYLIYSFPPTSLIAQDNLPYTTPYGWIDNQAPVFAAVGPQEVQSYNTLTFSVSAIDPDGDNVVSLYGGELPAGALFDPATGTFQWQPNSTQTGVYVVSFFAADDGLPNQTGQLDIVITVGQAESPADLTASMVAEITAQDFPTEIEASYSANVGKVDELLEKGNVTAVVNQYEVLLHKIDQDLKAGKITQEEANLLIMMANDGINLLN